MHRQHPEDGFLAEESREGENPGESERSYGHANHGDNQISPALPADLPEVVGVIFMNEDSGTEKEQGLEPRMGSQMKDAREVSPGGQSHYHKPKLANRRVGPDLF